MYKVTIKLLSRRLLDSNKSLRNGLQAVQKNAERYLELSKNMQVPYVMRLLDESSKPGYHCLDIGCGTGNTTSILAEKIGPNGHVIAFDPDEMRIKEANENYKRKNIDYNHGKILDLQLDGNSMDFVLSNFVFHWLSHNEKVSTFHEAHRVMKRDALFSLVTVLRYSDITNIILPYYPLEKTKQYEETFHTENENVYHDIFKELGFKTIFFENKLHTMTFQNEEIYFRWLDASNYTDFYSTYLKYKDEIKLPKNKDGHVVDSVNIASIILKK